MKKITKSEAAYLPHVKDRKCKDCRMFQPPAVCSLVQGIINKDGTCKYWEAKLALPVER